jgi:hypothetical protein
MLPDDSSLVPDRPWFGRIQQQIPVANAIWPAGGSAAPAFLLRASDVFSRLDKSTPSVTGAPLCYWKFFIEFNLAEKRDPVNHKWGNLNRSPRSKIEL